MAFVTAQGTVKVSWAADADAEEDELPMVYLRSLTGAEDEGSDRGGPLFSVCAIFNLKDLSPDAFTEALQARFREDLAEALGVDESQVAPQLSARDPLDVLSALKAVWSQVTIEDFAAGSLIVDVRLSGLKDAAASAALATKLAEECATLLDKHIFGKVIQTTSFSLSATRTTCPVHTCYIPLRR